MTFPLVHFCGCILTGKNFSILTKAMSSTAKSQSMKHESSIDADCEFASEGPFHHFTLASSNEAEESETHPEFLQEQEDMTIIEAEESETHPAEESETPGVKSSNEAEESDIHPESRAARYDHNIGCERRRRHSTVHHHTSNGKVNARHQKPYVCNRTRFGELIFKRTLQA